MQVCTSLQADNHASTSLLKFSTGRMPFLPPNQQRQSTEGTTQLELLLLLLLLSFTGCFWVNLGQSWYPLGPSPPSCWKLVWLANGWPRCQVPRLKILDSAVNHLVNTKGAVPAMKPEATTIGDPQDGHWKITLTFDGRRFCIPKFRLSTLQQMTRQWRHRWFPTTSCFGVTNHGRLALLWLVRQDRATINSGSPPSCDVTFWQWSVASLSEMGWLANKVSRYLSVLCLCPIPCEQWVIYVLPRV